MSGRSGKCSNGNGNAAGCRHGACYIHWPGRIARQGGTTRLSAFAGMLLPIAAGLALLLAVAVIVLILQRRSAQHDYASLAKREERLRMALWATG